MAETPLRALGVGLVLSTDCRLPHSPWHLYPVFQQWVTQWSYFSQDGTRMWLCDPVQNHGVSSCSIAPIRRASFRISLQGSANGVLHLPSNVPKYPENDQCRWWTGEVMRRTYLWVGAVRHVCSLPAKTARPQKPANPRVLVHVHATVDRSPCCPRVGAHSYSAVTAFYMVGLLVCSVTPAGPAVGLLSWVSTASQRCLSHYWHHYNSPIIFFKPTHLLPISTWDTSGSI